MRLFYRLNRFSLALLLERCSWKWGVWEREANYICFYPFGFLGYCFGYLNIVLLLLRYWLTLSLFSSGSILTDDSFKDLPDHWFYLKAVLTTLMVFPIDGLFIFLAGVFFIFAFSDMFRSFLDVFNYLLFSLLDSFSSVIANIALS
jgi:hypothetical protein